MGHRLDGSADDEKGQGEERPDEQERGEVAQGEAPARIEDRPLLPLAAGQNEVGG